MDTPNDGPWKRYLPLNMAIVGIDMLDFWDVSIRTWTWSLIHLFFWNCLIDLRTCAIQKLIAWLLNNLQRHSITYLTTSLISSINGSTILQLCANTLSRRTDWMSCLWVVGQHTPRESHGSSSVLEWWWNDSWIQDLTDSGNLSLDWLKLIRLFRLWHGRRIQQQQNCLAKLIRLALASPAGSKYTSFLLHRSFIVPSLTPRSDHSLFLRREPYIRIRQSHHYEGPPLSYVLDVP